MSKKIGELNELRFYLKAYERGWIVSKPFGDNAKYDFIVDVGGRLLRVQVKSTSVVDKTSKSRRYTMRVAHGRPGEYKSYTSSDIDIVAIYVIPEDAWYLIPIAVFNGCKHIYLSPFNHESKGKYEQFKEAWEELNYCKLPPKEDKQ